LNPAYPSKGERRYAVYRVACGAQPWKVSQSASLRQAQLKACQLQVKCDLIDMGFAMEGIDR
jgi:hypothetical protein